MLKKLASVLVLFLGLSGCVSLDKPREMQDRNQSLAFGYIHAEGTDTVLYRVRFAQAVPDSKEQILDARVRGGAFYLESLPNASYRVANIVRRLRKMSYVVELPASGPEALSFTIDKPGLHFLGSYKYTQFDRGNNKLEYELKPATWPTEKQVLEIILPRAQGTKWEELIRKRMGELK